MSIISELSRSSMAFINVPSGLKKTSGAYCPSPTTYSAVLLNNCRNTPLFEEQSFIT